MKKSSSTECIKQSTGLAQQPTPLLHSEAAHPACYSQLRRRNFTMHITSHLFTPPSHGGERKESKHPLSDKASPTPFSYNIFYLYFPVSLACFSLSANSQQCSASPSCDEAILGEGVWFSSSNSIGTGGRVMFLEIIVAVACGVMVCIFLFFLEMS